MELGPERAQAALDKRAAIIGDRDDGATQTAHGLLPLECVSEPGVSLRLTPSMPGPLGALTGVRGQSVSGAGTPLLACRAEDLLVDRFHAAGDRPDLEMLRHMGPRRAAER